MSPALPPLPARVGGALPASFVATRSNTFLWWISLGFLTITCLWDAHHWDMAIMSALGDAQGFAWRHNWWLETVLHDRAKHLSTLALLCCTCLIWKPIGPLRQLDRYSRVGLLVGVIMATLAISLMKRFSLTSCPWDLQIFGGTAQYVSHWAWGESDGGGGHCFPGGHASSALAYLAMALPLMSASSRGLRKTGWAIFGASLGIGLLFGAMQTLRGAHFPSHTWWTLSICWLVGWATHLAWGRMRRVQSSPRKPPL